jgi:hypothetical protein
MESPAYKITYVMGQQILQLPKDALVHKINHYTNQQILQGNAEIWLPDEPLTLNIRDVSAEKKLSKEQIEIIKSSNKANPNILIFIHGYNVGLGEYGRVMYTDSKHSSTCQQIEYSAEFEAPFDAVHDTLYFSEQRATICRLWQQQQSFGKAINTLKIKNDLLNGEAAHNWWLHMEYNLNKAAGFRGFDYQYQQYQPQYTRILNIAWSGDPASPLDYLAVEPIAEKTATQLYKVIKQLREEQIEINCVAHSAGNIVLIKMMELLGQDASYHNSLNRVFMWQPAMPDNVLSPAAQHEDDSLTGFWQTNHAYLAAKKIYVLYSHHDNILGPIPLNIQGQKDKRIVEKWHTPGGGKGMAVMALALDVIDNKLGVPNALKSCYHVAHLFHAPFNLLLFDDEFREKLYEHWYHKYGHRLDLAHHASNLVDQVKIIERDYTQPFNDLALFLSLYSAIKHDGLYSFLLNIKNDKRLSQFLLSLPPRLANQLSQNIAHVSRAAIDYKNWILVYNRLSRLAHKYVRFKYLKSLWDVLLHKQGQWLKHGASDMNEYLKAKVHDVLLYGPFYSVKKHVEINIDAWSYIINRFQNHKKSSESSLLKGYEIAKRGSEVAAFVITILNAPGTEPRPALGYSGINENDRQLQRLVSSGKIECIDQTDYLFHHSAMKITDFNDPVFHQVYQGVIMADKTMHFGQWQ